MLETNSKRNPVPSIHRLGSRKYGHRHLRGGDRDDGRRYGDRGLRRTIHLPTRPCGAMRLSMPVFAWLSGVIICPGPADVAAGGRFRLKSGSPQRSSMRCSIRRMAVSKNLASLARRGLLRGDVAGVFFPVFVAAGRFFFIRGIRRDRVGRVGGGREGADWISRCRSCFGSFVRFGQSHARWGGRWFGSVAILLTAFYPRLPPA